MQNNKTQLTFGDQRALAILDLERGKHFIKYEVSGKLKLQRCASCDDVNSDQFQLHRRYKGVDVFACFSCGYLALKPKTR